MNVKTPTELFHSDLSLPQGSIVLDLVCSAITGMTIHILLTFLLLLAILHFF